MHRTLAWLNLAALLACGGRTKAADSVPEYWGVVAADMSEFDQTGAESFTAGFGRGPAPSSVALDGSAGEICVGNCCLTRPPSLILPDPGAPPPPAAGDIGFAQSGMTLATLAPPGYSATIAVDGSVGNTLDVSASGGDLAPFSGTLTIPRLPTPSVPAIGSATVLISRSTEFRISWTPEGAEGETAVLEIISTAANGVDGVVCRETDVGGLIEVDATLLAALGPGKATIDLERTITTVIQSSNASISLEGTSAITGPATIGD